MGLNERDNDKYSPFSIKKCTTGKKISLKEFLSLRIDLTAKVDFNDTLDVALAKATMRYYCACGKQINYAIFKRYDGQCKQCHQLNEKSP